MDKELSRIAAILGKKGGKWKGPKGFAKLSKKERSEISKAAAQKRWKKTA